MDPKFGTVTIENHLPVPITNNQLMETAPDIRISRTEQINTGQREVIEVPEFAGRLFLILSDERTYLTDNRFFRIIWNVEWTDSFTLPGYQRHCLADLKGLGKFQTGVKAH